MTPFSELEHAGTKMPRHTQLVILDREQRMELARIAKHLATAQEMEIRARIVLGAADGLSNLQLARALHTTVHTVLKWQRRWEAEGLVGILSDWPRSGRTKKIGERQEASVIEAPLDRNPKSSAQRNARMITAASRLSPATEERIWVASGLRPDQMDEFRFRTNPEFARRLDDLVGLYISRLQSALLLSADEEYGSGSEDQSDSTLIDRPEPLQAQTADACLDRVNTFMAALSLLWDEVINRCPPKEGNQEFLDFLDQVDLAVGKALVVHSVMDNRQVLRCHLVRNWFAKHPRYHLHFTSSGSSWLVEVEGWLDEISRLHLQQDAFRNAPSVVYAMLAHTSLRNTVPGSFKWTASPALVRAAGNPG